MMQAFYMKKIASILLVLFMAHSIQAQDYSSDSVPVRLKYIQASQNNNSSTLQWAVVCLLDFAKFDIQRSDDGITYTSIHQFQADKARCLNAFEHEDKNASGRSFYRIRVGDLDGRYYTSKTIVVYGREKGFEITSLSPSVVTNNTYLSVSTATNDRVEIVITDSKGVICSRKRYPVQNGNNDLPINCSRLEKGIYFITLINQSGQRKVSRFLKQ